MWGRGERGRVREYIPILWGARVLHGFHAHITWVPIMHGCHVHIYTSVRTPLAFVTDQQM